MKKFIKLKIIEKDHETVKFMITDQSHRGVDFGNDGASRFTASNGFILSSSAHPAVSLTTFYVRGSNEADDRRIVSINKNDFKILITAVKEYNKVFSDKEPNQTEEYLKRLGVR